MTRFIGMRVVRGIVIIFALVLVTFFLTRTFADPARIIVGADATRAEYEQMRKFLGSDLPTGTQLANYLEGLVHGDLGESTSRRAPAADIVLDSLPATFILAGSALFLGLIFGIPLGLFGVLRARSSLKEVLAGVPVLLVSLADFWVGILLILVFAVNLGWLPTSGYGTWQQLILPAVTLSLRPIGRTARMVREAVEEELSKKYVTFALSTGLTPKQVLRKHVLKNVSPTFVTMLGYEFVLVFTGYAVLVESVFQWPGVGHLAASSVLQHDVVLISAIVIVVGLLVAFTNTLVDIIHGLIDRRLALKS